MTISIIAIKGNHLKDVAKIFEQFNYVDINRDKIFENALTLNEYLWDNYFELADKSIALRGIWFCNNWTIISDPEMTDATDEDTLLKLSEKLNTEVFSFIVQNTSSTFSFSKFYKIKLRDFFASEGEVLNNIGNSLNEEEFLNLNHQTTYEDIIKLSQNLGINIEGCNNKHFIAKQFSYNDYLQKELKKFKPKEQSINLKKPWWKIF